MISNDGMAEVAVRCKLLSQPNSLLTGNNTGKFTTGLRDTELFSAKRSELDGALMGVPAMGKTALYDAIDAALTHLQKATRDKKALIVISDGGDNASKHTPNQVLQEAERSDAIIYTIGLFDIDDVDRNPRVLRQIAHATGGQASYRKRRVRLSQSVKESPQNSAISTRLPTHPRIEREMEATGRSR